MESRESLYNKKGMYAGYDKNHKERESLDYYSTPTEEVENILNKLDLNFNNLVILEPSCGGGHMYNGISNYCYDHGQFHNLIATDIMERGGDFPHESGPEFDFISDDYPYTKDIDYIIMNPPFKLIEPFCMKALGIAKKGVLMFGRIQFLEGINRYEKILKDYPPTDIYVYVDRVCCYPNGDTSKKPATIQCYAWYYWDIRLLDSLKEESIPCIPNLFWIRKADKT